MILDSSALISILVGEPGCLELVSKLALAPHVAAGAPTLAETGIVLTHRAGKDARLLIDAFLAETGTEIVRFDEAHWREAVVAFRRYGKGRHPAALTFGDCMTYAVAKLSDEPLLCIGDDFRRTDLELA